MSPNNNHHLESYQHCQEHESMNVGDDSGNDDSAIDVGQVGVGDYDRQATIKNSFPSLELLQQRIKSKAVLIILVGALSLGIGWFAFDNVFSPDCHGPAIKGGSTEQQPDENDAANHIPDLIWSDEFDGDSIDLKKWTFVDGDGCDVGLCGWGQFESAIIRLGTIISSIL